MTVREIDWGENPDGSITLDRGSDKPRFTPESVKAILAQAEASSEDYGSSKSGNWRHRGTPGSRGGSAPGTTVRVLGMKRDGGEHGVDLEDWEGDRKAVANMALYHYDSGSDRLALVEHEGEVVGVIGLSEGRSRLPDLDGEFVELYDVATKRAGYGHQTMAHAAKLAADDGMGLQLTAINQAVGFYDKAGMNRHPLWGSDDKRAWMVERKFYWTAEETAAIAEQFSTLAELEPENGVFVHTPKKERQPQENFGSSKSGNYGHKGVPGQRGGSAARGGIAAAGWSAEIPYKPTDEYLDKVEDEVMLNMMSYAADEEKEAAATVARLQEKCDNTPISIRQGYEEANGILEDGRFKTAFETGTSGMLLDIKGRTAAEKAGMGYPADVDPKLRPIYGYLDQRHTEMGSIGHVEFVLKDKVKDRTTVTVADSLYAMEHATVAPTPMRKVEVESIDTAGMYIAEKPVQDWDNIGYIETQTHGGLSMDDVEKIIVHGDGTPVGSMRIKAMAWGVEVEHDQYSD